MKRRLRCLLAVFLLTGWVLADSAQALDAQGWFERGNELSAQKRFEEAAAAYEKSIEQNPKSPTAHYNLGIAHKNLKDYGKAAAAFEKTLELEPTHLDARLRLGNAYNMLERWQEAIGELNIVVHRRQNDAEAHGNLGWALYNYREGPRFKRLVILNLQKAVNLFRLQNMPQAAEATQNVLNQAIAEFGYQERL